MYGRKNVMEEIEITIVNWEKYNPPSDRAKHPYWFRFNRDSAISAGLDGLSGTQCWVWIQVLSECSRKNSATIRFRVKRMAELSQTTEKDVSEAINMLTKNETVSQSGELTPPIRGVGLPHRQTDIHTDRQENSVFLTEEVKRAWSTFCSRDWLDKNLPSILLEFDQLQENTPFADNVRKTPKIVRLRQMIKKRWEKDKPKEKPIGAQGPIGGVRV